MKGESPQKYPVVDLFAGPDGLGEGFASNLKQGLYSFVPLISIERDPFAHRTLHLRHFFRSFEPSMAPPEYYEYIAGYLARERLGQLFPTQWQHASESAVYISLEPETQDEVNHRISGKLKGVKKWVLVGGPPCQAYSLVGRSRSANIPSFEDDEKHFLYREYLKIITDFQPSVFVMENVKGLLSAKVKGEPVLQKILSDLSRPKKAIGRLDNGLVYRLYSLSEHGEFKGEVDPSSFIVKAEEYGVPQARHRMFIVGIRSDIDLEPETLEKQQPIHVQDVLGSLPRIRSGISKGSDSSDRWRELLRNTAASRWIKRFSETHDLQIQNLMKYIATTKNLPTQKQSSRYAAPPKMHEWLCDERLETLSLHESRSHMETDLQRYFFAATWAPVAKSSPKLSDFPLELLPAHRNVQDGRNGTMFADRFRVQLPDRASTTITAHISKDGHYYIHYDPSQSRSLTVREAARLQTFPDNYYFEGPRTSQFHQVGNAVPPYLASQIAAIIKRVLDKMPEE
jgi:DNA (cytosine-5)-methyltransferase 1